VDFTPSEAQQAVVDLSGRIMGDHLDMDRHLAVETAGGWFDRELWGDLAAAGLLGIALGVDVGGSGLDAVALALLLGVQGSHVAPLPLLPSSVAALIVDRHGSDEQRQRLLPDVVTGTTILTVAVQEYLDDRLTQPSTTFEDGLLHGTKVVVEHLDVASSLLVTVRTPDGPRCVLVDATAAGITRREGSSTRRQPIWEVDFDATPAEPVGDDTTVDALLDHLRLGICATQLGVTERALSMTAGYTSTREQFGRPIATFQAVGQRLADQFVNVGGIRLVTLSAAWRLANGVDATEDLLISKWWASERATDVANATQHCHGGMGVAADYPLHRYTLWNKHLTTSLGAGTQSLRALGDHLAR
jgi:alkylation response protein AidB-like acyl-CoA dehydrogenase